MAARKLAIVICGGPPVRHCSWDQADDHYRLISDGLSMGEVFRTSGYDVHCFYSVAMVQWYADTIRTLAHDDILSSGGAWDSGLGSDVIWDPSKSHTLQALGTINLNNYDQIALYVRSHGRGTEFFDPTGDLIDYQEILDIFTSRRVTGQMLWIVDACRSGLIGLLGPRFQEADRNGLHCRVITSAGRDMSPSNYGGIVPASSRLCCMRSRRVALSSVFRHRLMLYIEINGLFGGAQGGITWDTAVAAVGQTEIVTSKGILWWRREIRMRLGSRHFSFGAGLPHVSDWITVRPNEPNLGGHNGVSCPGGAGNTEASELCELWAYGTFVCSLPENPVSRKRALSDHGRLAKLIESVYRDLNVPLGKDATVSGDLTGEQLDMFTRLMRKVNKCVYLEGPHFTPDYSFLKNLVVTYEKDESAIVSAMEKASKAYGLSEIPEPIGEVVNPFAFLDLLDKSHAISQSDKIRISSELAELPGISELAKVRCKVHNSKGASHKRSHGRKHRHGHKHRRRRCQKLREVDCWIDPFNLCCRSRLRRGHWM